MRLPHPIYIASIVLFLIAIHIFAAAPSNPKFGKWLYDWQDLVAGVLALVGAYWALMGIRQQIDVSERHEDMRLRRRHNAVRATLPLTLSGLTEPLRDMMRALDAVRPDVRANGFTSCFNPPAVPAQYVIELQAVIASTNQRDVIIPISEAIRQIQTLWSRVETLRDEREQQRRAGLEMNIDDWIVQAAQTHAIIESLFEYARDESDQGPSEVSWERAESIIFQLGIESRNLAQHIARGLEKSPNFWILR